MMLNVRISIVVLAVYFCNVMTMVMTTMTMIADHAETAVSDTPEVV